MIRGYPCCSLPFSPDLAAIPSNGTLKNKTNPPLCYSAVTLLCLRLVVFFSFLCGSHSLKVFLAGTPKPSALFGRCFTLPLYVVFECLSWAADFCCGQLFNLILRGVSLSCAFMCQGCFCFFPETLALLKEYLWSAGWSYLQLVKLRLLPGVFSSTVMACLCSFCFPPHLLMPPLLNWCNCRTAWWVGSKYNFLYAFFFSSKYSNLDKVPALFQLHEPTKGGMC